MIAMNSKEQRTAAIAFLLFGAAAMIPLADEGYYLSLSVNIVMYVVLCTAWTLFSGPTHYISLATAAFFGIGTYSVGLGIDLLPFPVLLLVAAVASGILAGLVGVATLRLSGVYFVIFTLGLAELVRQVVTWLQVKFAGAVGSLCIHRFHREAHFLDAAGAGGGGLCHRLAGEPLPARICHADHRQ